MANIGNTCFLNCILQCLFHGPLWHYLCEARHKQTCQGSACIVCDLEDLVQQYARCAKGGYIAPRTVARRMLTEDVGMSFGRMHDAHEFMAHLLDQLLNSNLKGAPQHESHDLQDAQECMTLQHHLFGSLLVNVVECEGCGHKTPGRAERCVAFMLPMQAPTGASHAPSSGLRAWVRGAAQRVGERVGVVEGATETVEDLLRYFISPVEIEDYRCDGCGKKAADMAGKRICMREALADAPRVLALAIKRFSGGHFGKLCKPVTFQQTLDLAPFMDPGSMDCVGGAGNGGSRHIWAGQQRPLSPGPCLYALTGVVVHRGLMNSVNAGHYIAYVRSDEGWLCIDDEEVTPTTWETVAAVNAYMLFYKKLAAGGACSAPGEFPVAGAGVSADAESAPAPADGDARVGSPSVGAGSPPWATSSSDSWSDALRGMEHLYMPEPDEEGEGTSVTNGGCDDSAVGGGITPAAESPTAQPPPLVTAGGSVARACPFYEVVEQEGIPKVFGGAAHYRLSLYLPNEESLQRPPGEEVSSSICGDWYRFESAGYKVCVQWPREVDAETSRARFVRASRKLVVHAAISRL
jgi:ubiquitin C-terminal hydrolase